MSAHNDLVYVRHILRALDKICDYTAHLTEAQFKAIPLVQDAVVRQFEIVGEATKKVSADFCEQHAAVPWSHMAKMRDVLIHHYWEVDLNVVWTTVQKDVPRLLPLLRAIITQE